MDAAPPISDAAPLSDAAAIPDAAPIPDVAVIPDVAPMADVAPVADMAPDAAVPDVCVPSCGDALCGADGCGGECGACVGDAPRCVEGRCQPLPTVRISEVVARNDDGLRDAEGDASDWIELHNFGRAGVALEGLALSDDLDRPARWSLPARVLPAGERLLVFASGRDLRPDEGELHADFRLDADGEPVLLTADDGATVVDAWTPAFPPQHPDVAYGVPEAVERVALVQAGDVVAWFVPRDDRLGDAWRRLDFDDADWGRAATGLGFLPGGAVAPDPADLPDVALGRPTEQSSTLGGFVSGLAVDGDPRTFTATFRDDLEPRWTVTLDDDVWVGRIILHNRVACCPQRLRDITVSVEDGAGLEVWRSPLLNPEDVLGGPAQLTVDPAVVGRRVHVDRTADPDLSGTNGAGNADEPSVLTLGEVEVRADVAGLRPFLASDLSEEMADATSLYVRALFQVAAPDALDVLHLRVTHDAGFAVWLNGVPVSAVHAPEPPLRWDSAATREARDGVAVTELNLTEHLALLVPGENLLALQGLDADGDDFLLLPELEGAAIEVGAEARYFPEPTPGAPNTTPSYAGLVAPVTASRPRGLVDGPVEVELATETEGATIVYTLDGSPPTPETGTPYEVPIAVETSTAVRAVAYLEDWRPTPVSTWTWIIPSQVRDQTQEAVLARGLPDMWRNAIADYGVDPRVAGPGDLFDGRYADRFEADLRTLPTLAISLPPAELFGPEGIYAEATQHGVRWERAASVEVLTGDPATELQIDCGLRIQGGAFRNHSLTRKHSFRLLFKTLYGPSKLRHPILGPDAPYRFDTLILRANGADGWQWAWAGAEVLYARDAFGRETVLAMGGVAGRSAFFHLYLNGLYWGLYEAVERPDAAFAATHLGGEKEDWDVQNSGRPVDGDLESWNALRARLGEGVAEVEDWLELAGLDDSGARNLERPASVDMTSLADYMLANLYMGSDDWPHHNYYIARPRDGRLGFQFLMWDSEVSVGLRSPVGVNKIGVSAGVAEPWAALRASPEFRLRVADRAQRHLLTPGGALWVDPRRPRRQRPCSAHAGHPRPPRRWPRPGVRALGRPAPSEPALHTGRRRCRSR